VRLLLVEDDPDHASLTLRALRRTLPEVDATWIEDGETALEWIQACVTPDSRADSLPDLVLLDLKLPRLSGHGVLEAIKSEPRTRHLPVVVFTTSAAEVDRAAAHERYVNAYVVKPMDYDGLKAFAAALDAFWSRWHEG
jgi:CheY-like chemotaxis protein